MARAAKALPLAAPEGIVEVTAKEFISKEDERFQTEEGLLVHANVTSGPNFWSAPVFLEGLAESANDLDVAVAVLSKYGLGS